VMS
ncbi:acetyltransferase domain protein, partial [Vibrio parahaemolyticus V-223/04]|jgi:hypothetical protein